MDKGVKFKEAFSFWGFLCVLNYSSWDLDNFPFQSVLLCKSTQRLSYLTELLCLRFSSYYTTIPFVLKFDIIKCNWKHLYILEGKPISVSPIKYFIFTFMLVGKMNHAATSEIQ